jgi:putative ABC transport system permease protein
MKLTDIILSANQSLLRNKARTILTVIAIFIGSTTLSLTNGIGSGIKSYLNKQVGDLGNTSSLVITSATASTKLSSENNGLTKYNPGEKKIAGTTPRQLTEVALTQSDINKIAKIPNIMSVGPSITVTPDYIAPSTNPNAKYQFSLAQTVGKSSLDMASGRVVSNMDGGNEISIPDNYIGSLGFANNADAVGKSVTIAISNAFGQQSNVKAIITGVQQKSLISSITAYGNNALVNSLYTIQTTGLPANAIDGYGSLVAVYKSSISGAQLTTLQNRLKAEGYSGETVKDQISTVFTVISALTDVLDGFGAITLLAAAFGIVNTLYMSVSERTKEIGLMKALGMGKQRIFLLFSIEAILIGFWGSVIGVGFANIIGRLVDDISSKGFLKDFTGLQLLSFPARPSITIILAIMLIAFLAGTLPARRASQKDPIDALRYE